MNMSFKSQISDFESDLNSMQLRLSKQDQKLFMIGKVIKDSGLEDCYIKHYSLDYEFLNVMQTKVAKATDISLKLPYI